MNAQNQERKCGVITFTTFQNLFPVIMNNLSALMYLASWWDLCPAGTDCSILTWLLRVITVRSVIWPASLSSSSGMWATLHCLGDPYNSSRAGRPLRVLGVFEFLCRRALWWSCDHFSRFAAHKPKNQPSAQDHSCALSVLIPHGHAPFTEKSDWSLQYRQLRTIWFCCVCLMYMYIRGIWWHFFSGTIKQKSMQYRTDSSVVQDKTVRYKNEYRISSNKYCLCSEDKDANPSSVCICTCHSFEILVFFFAFSVCGCVYARVCLRVCVCVNVRLRSVTALQHWRTWRPHRLPGEALLRDEEDLQGDHAPAAALSHTRICQRHLPGSGTSKLFWPPHVRCVG